MAAETVAALIEGIGALWPLGPDLEVTLEANPTSVEAGRFRDFRAAGVDRVSVGVQAFDDAALAFLGRGHSAAEALAALELAAGIFPRWSFDLIYARHGQTEVAWMAELEQALALGAGHLSLYQLTIEPGTAFHARWRQGALALPDDETQATMFELTQARCLAAGVPAYEVSNHARAGEASRHNLAYWRGGAYLGIGPGAHGRLDRQGRRQATVAHRRPERWLAAVEAAGHGIATSEVLAPEAASKELLMMGLRLVEGVPLDRFSGPGLAPLDAVVEPEARHRLEDDGYLETASGRLRVTEQGRLLLNTILRQLLR
jgi:oxygen-independent coproporphyrinogen-3 oxidase